MTHCVVYFNHPNVPLCSPSPRSSGFTSAFAESFATGPRNGCTARGLPPGLPAWGQPSSWRPSSRSGPSPYVSAGCSPSFHRRRRLAQYRILLVSILTIAQQPAPSGPRPTGKGWLLCAIRSKGTRDTPMRGPCQSQNPSSTTRRPPLKTH